MGEKEFNPFKAFDSKDGAPAETSEELAEAKKEAGVVGEFDSLIRTITHALESGDTKLGIIGLERMADLQRKQTRLLEDMGAEIEHAGGGKRRVVIGNLSLFGEFVNDQGKKPADERKPYAIDFMDVEQKNSFAYLQIKDPAHYKEVFDLAVQNAKSGDKPELVAIKAEGDLERLLRK